MSCGDYIGLVNGVNSEHTELQYWRILEHCRWCWRDNEIRVKGIEMDLLGP